MKKTELEQIIADQADQIAALIERNDQLLEAVDEYKSIAFRALNIADGYKNESIKLRRTIKDIIHKDDYQDIHFPNTEKEP